ncbi:hypothetical protein HPB48_022521 [Haemaphysalis longicornis]|uniref:CCHC-type domain-containing protein n=1 Tax=Haemaphysalis longicornis TaxID=44386 RepID=A0A9J6GUQ6_HAELO|nr:hypothetical protein HPB48_022521 [Haemaphysalis longicornis]
MCRGVIYRVDPSETAESLRRALYSESHHIIAARLMGKRGACLVTFEGTRPPRTIRYWSVLTKVFTYEARSLVCHNCQGLGHKKDICPHPSTCAECGRQHSVDGQCMDQTSYCRNCKQSGHLGTDAECPTRRGFEERSKERAKECRSRSRNRRRSRRRSSSWNHGNRFMPLSETSPSRSRSRSVGAPAASQLDRAAASPSSQIAKEATNKKVTYASATASIMPPIQRSAQPSSTQGSPALTPATDDELGAMIAALREEERDLHNQVQEIRREMERALAEVNARIAEKAARRKELQARLRGSRAEHAATPMVFSPPSVVQASLQGQVTTDHIVETCVQTIMDKLVRESSPCKPAPLLHLRQPQCALKPPIMTHNNGFNFTGYHPWTTVLQWNCRSFRRRKADFIDRFQLIQGRNTPAIIALQEVNGPLVRIPSYEGYAPRDDATQPVKAALFIHRGFTHVELDTQPWCNAFTEVAGCRVEISPHRAILVFSVYISPEGARKKSQLSHIDLSFVQHFQKLYPKDVTVMCGDFNAQHVAWGYEKTSALGKHIMADATAYGPDVAKRTTDAHSIRPNTKAS